MWQMVANITHDWCEYAMLGKKQKQKLQIGKKLYTKARCLENTDLIKDVSHISE